MATQEQSWFLRLCRCFFPLPSGDEIIARYDYNIPALKRAAQRIENGVDLVPLLKHRSGYVRESACMRAGEILDPCLIVPLVVRCNDWVAEVRRAAKTSLTAYLRPQFYNEFVSALPSIHHLYLSDRASHGTIIETVNQWIASQPQFRDLFAVPNIHGQKTAQILAKLWTAYPQQNERSQFCDWAIGTKIPDIILSLATLEPPASPEEFNKIVQALLSSSMARVRHVGLALLAKQSPDSARAIAGEYLFSAYEPNRILAASLLSLGPDDIKNRWRTFLQSDNGSTRELVVVINLCAQSRDASFAPLLVPYLQHRSPLVQGCALRALGMLQYEQYEAEIHAALVAVGTRQQHMMLKLLVDLDKTLPLEFWQDIAHREMDDRTARLLMHHARRTSRWTQLGLALHLSQTPALQLAADMQIRKWREHFNRSATRHNDAELAWIEYEFSQLNGKLGLEEYLRFYI